MAFAIPVFFLVYSVSSWDMSLLLLCGTRKKISRISFGIKLLRTNESFAESRLKSKTTEHFSCIGPVAS